MIKTRFKFLRTGLNSDNGTKRKWVVNKWRKEDEIELCSRGFHCSKTPLQALDYVQGEILAIVEVKGKGKVEKDKECYPEMRIIKAWNWTKEDSVSLAIYSAELVINIFEKKYPDDKRPHEAIEAAKNHLKVVKSGDEKKIKSAANAAANAAYAANAAADATANAAYAAANAASHAAHAANAANAAHAANAAANAAYAAAKKKVIKKLDDWFLTRIKSLTKYE